MATTRRGDPRIKPGAPIYQAIESIARCRKHLVEGPSCCTPSPRRLVSIAPLTSIPLCVSILVFTTSVPLCASSPMRSMTFPHAPMHPPPDPTPESLTSTPQSLPPSANSASRPGSLLRSSVRPHSRFEDSKVPSPPCWPKLSHADNHWNYVENWRPKRPIPAPIALFSAPIFTGLFLRPAAWRPFSRSKHGAPRTNEPRKVLATAIFRVEPHKPGEGETERLGDRGYMIGVPTALKRAAC